jgi:GNAT superfamily N-acetyltransferase
MTIADLRIRDASPGDALVIAEFNARLARETEHLELDMPTLQRGVEKVLADASRGHYFVAEAGGDVVGCTMVTYEWSDWRDRNLWWIQSVYIRSDWRRRGVFRALYGHVRQAALDAGAGGLRLYVERENKAAQRTYESLGMVTAPYAVMAEMFGRPAGAGSID